MGLLLFTLSREGRESGGMQPEREGGDEGAGLGIIFPMLTRRGS